MVDRPPRPEPLPVVFENIPGELRYLNQWLLWRYVWTEDKGKWDKPPFQPSGKLASSTAKLTWSPFQAVKEAYERGLSLPVDDPLHFSGVGFVPAKVSQAENILQFGDLDKCRDKETGQLSPEAREDLGLLNTYCEVSPSGTGIRFIAKGAPPYPAGKDGGKNGGIELYQARHYLTITGHRLEGYSATIEIRTGELNKFYNRHFVEGEDEPDQPKESPPPTKLTDDQIIGQASEAANSKKFMALMSGDISGYPSHSEADQALCNILAFYTTSERHIDSIFRRSGLYREKWERADYRESTIGKALSFTAEHYNGNRPTAEEPPEAIRSKAREILQNGDPIQFITDSCGRMVLGAEKAFRKLICCKAVQSVRQSAGLHPKLSGESGSGKTWAVLTFAHHLPAESVIKGSSSNLAAFYHQDGTQVFRILDDYQAGNETLDTIIKQTSSVFHQPYDHRTVKKQEPLTLHIGSEQTWAVTSVDSSQDIQVLNRQIPINIDDSEELTIKVNRRTIERYGKGEEQFPEDESVQVCREIWRILQGDGLINVRIPYFERIEWLDTSNRRNPSIFMDLVVAHAAMYRYQRERDSEGYYLATEVDFQAAKALFTDKDAEELVHRLTKKEREFADLLCKRPEGLTREEAAKFLNISGNRISQLANGEKGRGGLTQKLPGFEIVEITDSVRVDEDRHRAIKRILYKLTKYDPLTGFEAVVRLRPKSDIGNDSKDGKEPVSHKVRKLENKEIDNRERENREKETGSKDSKEKVRERNGQLDKTSKSSLSLSNPEKSLLIEKSISEASSVILTEKHTNPYRPYSMSSDIESKSLPTEEQPKDPQPAREVPASEKIRAAAMMEYGIAGWVDPVKLSQALKLPLDEVMAWLKNNYEPYDRPGGGVGYRQHKASEALA